MNSTADAESEGVSALDGVNAVGVVSEVVDVASNSIEGLAIDISKLRSVFAYRAVAFDFVVRSR